MIHSFVSILRLLALISVTALTLAAPASAQSVLADLLPEQNAADLVSGADCALTGGYTSGSFTRGWATILGSFAATVGAPHSPDSPPDEESR